jgi:signal transduction histidine kinase
MESAYLRALDEVSKIITLGAPLQAVFDTALEQMVTFMEADTGSIQLLEGTDMLKTVAIQGDIARRLYAVVDHFRVSDSGLEHVLASDRAHVIHNLTRSLALADPLSRLLQLEELTTAIFIALRVQGKSIGTLSVAFHAPRQISPTRLAWFEAMTNLISVSVHNARLLDNLQAKQSELQRAWKLVTDAQETERRRLSRELHDEVGQALTSIMLRLKALQTETDIEVIGDRLNGLRYLTGQTLEEVRRISMDLRPVVFDELGLVPAIRWYVHESTVRTSMDISFHLTGEPYPLLSEQEIACYRALQEALTNIIRHAQASSASVELAFEPDLLRLNIHDDGVGMPTPFPLNGVGLMGLQERVRLVGGTVGIFSEPGEGVTLSIAFPRVDACSTED